MSCRLNSGRHTLGLITLVTGISLALCSCMAAEALVEEAVPVVRAAAVRQLVLPEEVSSFGSLSFVAKADISAPGDGVLESLPFNEGDSTRAGDIVAVIVNPQAELAVARARSGVAQAEAALSLARARLFEGRLAAESRMMSLEKSWLELAQARREFAEAERKQLDLETLFRAGGVPEESVRAGRFSIAGARQRIEIMELELNIQTIGLRDDDIVASGAALPADPEKRGRLLVDLAVAGLEAEKEAAAARLEATRKDLESAMLALSELTVRTPVSGVVAARYLEPGERAKREDRLLSIMEVQTLHVVVSVGEPEALLLAPGMKARVQVDGASVEFDARVDRISPHADPGSASFTVKAIITDPDPRLKPGMFARMRVCLGAGKTVVIVPESAIADSSAQGATLYTVVGGAIAKKKVRLGDVQAEGRIVEAGVSAGEVVVDGPDGTLKEGDRVKISW